MLGMLGGMYWGTRQIIRGRPGFLGLGLAGAIEMFMGGTVFSFVRQSALTIYAYDILEPHEPVSEGSYVAASALAGAIAGGVTVPFTRDRLAIRRCTLWSMAAAAAGQYALNFYYRPRPERVPLWKRFVAMKWSPIQFLSLTDHREMLREKLLHVEVEMAIIDDKIAAIRKEAPPKESEESK